MDELPEELTSDRKLILHLLEKRRGKLKEKILAELAEHPEVLERLEQRRKKAGRTAGKAESGSCSEMEALEGRASQKTDFCIHPFPGP